MTAPLVDESHPVTGARCNRRRWNGTRLCSMPADVLLTGMCVHEHVSESPYCTHHAGPARDGKRGCEPCWRGAEPHRCLVTVIAESGMS